MSAATLRAIMSTSGGTESAPCLPAAAAALPAAMAAALAAAMMSAAATAAAAAAPLAAACALQQIHRPHPRPLPLAFDPRLCRAQSENPQSSKAGGHTTAHIYGERSHI